jgi:hypothetical protein
VVYEPITTAQLGALAPENIPKQIVTLRNTQSRGITQSFLSLSPIVQDEYGFKRVKSFLTVSIPQPLRPHHQTK